MRGISPDSSRRGREGGNKTGKDKAKERKFLKKKEGKGEEKGVKKRRRENKERGWSF